MDIGSRDGAVLVGAYSLVNSVAGFLAAIDPGKSFLRPQGYLYYVVALKAGENFLNVVAAVILIAGTWHMDDEPDAAGRRGSHMKLTAAYFKNPRRVLVIFTVWHLTASPGSVGADIFLGYHASDTNSKFALSTTIRVGMELLK
ncbi:uncharacterized protein LOC135387017 isoform X2 [Ornithodoros turicata]